MHARVYIQCRKKILVMLFFYNQFFVVGNSTWRAFTMLSGRQMNAEFAVNYQIVREIFIVLLPVASRSVKGQHTMSFNDGL